MSAEMRGEESIGEREKIIGYAKQARRWLSKGILAHVRATYVREGPTNLWRLGPASLGK